MKSLFLEFIKTEKASSIILLMCTILSLLLANSGISIAYIALWQFPLLGHPISYWINDGLMMLFFLLVGLEIEREIYVGELSQPRKAVLPIVAAIGGMAIPALIHMLFNVGTATQSGIGIPMATDIAFALGVLSLLGNRIPLGLKIFLTALAIIDDLGAVVMIALFYTGGISLSYLALALITVSILFTLNKFGINNVTIYLIGGIPLWYFIHEAGIHATISGVILAFIIPFRRGDKISPSHRIQHGLHYVVAFMVLPLFAVVNTAFQISTGWYESLFSQNSIGIILGLVVGKFTGISIFSWISVRIGLCSLPEEVSWKQIFGVAALAGIGFTMSIFITHIAFNERFLIEQSKIAILTASVIAGIVGYAILYMAAWNQEKAKTA